MLQLRVQITGKSKIAVCSNRTLHAPLRLLVVCAATARWCMPESGVVEASAAHRESFPQRAGRYLLGQRAELSSVTTAGAWDTSRNRRASTHVSATSDSLSRSWLCAAAQRRAQRRIRRLSRASSQRLRPGGQSRTRRARSCEAPRSCGALGLAIPSTVLTLFGRRRACAPSAPPRSPAASLRPRWLARFVSPA